MKSRIVIIGAGPAGLACAWRLIQQHPHTFNITILEKDANIGGLAKTLEYKGCRFDIGGHRFYTKIPDVLLFYTTIIGKKMKQRQRLSRIYFRGQYYHYPLQITDVLKRIGYGNAVWIVLSYCLRQIHRHPKETSFTQWVEKRFGDALFSLFFRSYTEKVWGIPTEKLSAEWAKQRIQNFSLPVAAMNAITRSNATKVKTIITQFLYPDLGPGQLYESLARDLETRGVKIIKNATVTGISKENKKITAVTYTKNKKRVKLTTDSLVSTMPFQELVSLLSPPPRVEHVLKELRFRHLITVNYRVKGEPFPDNWIYIHDKNVLVGRIQNFRNWSSFMKKGNVSPISLEYFCNEGDSLWNKKDSELLTLGKSEISKIKLFDPSDILDGFVHRVKDAYPVYTVDYQTPLTVAKEYTDQIKNLYPCGRGGLFRYNNMDHSIKTGFIVAETILKHGIKENQWDFGKNDYLEEE